MPTINLINVGLAPNDKKGDPLRDAMQKVNLNTSALNTAIQGVLDTKGRPSGYASLGTDGRLLAAQAPIVYSDVLPTAAHDLNTYVTPGTYYQSTVAGATYPTGNNYPIAQVGFLEVVATGAPVLQEYTTRVAGVASQRFWRLRISSTSWSNWKELVDSAALASVKSTADAALAVANLAIPAVQKASANGVGSLDASGRQPIAQLPAPIALPTTAHDLDTYDQDGTFGQNATAGAVAGSNYPPEKVAGVLTVQRGGANNILAHQWYRTYFVTNSTIYYRNKNAGGWGDWVRIAKYNEAMTHTFLATATDANSLVADNTWWSWTTGTVMSANFPPAPVVSSGIITNHLISASYMVQTCMMTPGSNRRPIEYRRIGNGTSTWSGWRIITPVQLVTDLPTADCGDVLVDGLGLYRWIDGGYYPAATSTVLPTTAHDLAAYLTPGARYYQGSGGAATVANGYPEGATTGFLEVETYGTATLQRYTNRAAAARAWWRTKTGASAWSGWFEYANMAQAMTHTFLTAATDCNTLVADNAFYTWRSGTVVSSGTNWPPAANISGGSVEVRYTAADMIVQTVTLLVNNGRSRVFQRMYSGTTWQGWKIMTPISSPGWLPTADCGDVDVDGIGKHSFVGNAYSPNRLPPRHRSGGTMSLVGTVPTRTLQIQPFQLRSDDDTVDLIGTSAINKVFQASGNWSAGNNGNAIVSGGTGSLTLFDVYAIRNESTGVIDVCATTSGNTLTPPTGWGRSRLLGTIYFSTSTGSIWNFMQVGNQFLLHNGVLIVENGGLNANTPVTVGVIAPHGRRTRARLMAHGGAGTPGTNFTVYPADLIQNYGGIYNQVPDSSVTGGRSAQVDVLTSTTRLIAVATVQSFVGGLYLASQGWTEIEGW